LTVLKLTVLLCVAAPFVAAVLMTPLSIRVAKKIGAIDMPKDDRRMHKQPIPRFGGLAIFVATSLMLLIIREWVMPYISRTFPYYVHGEPYANLSGILVGGILIYVLGVLDDLHNLNAVLKFFCQIVIASITFLLGVRIPAIRLLGLDFGGDSLGALVVSYLVTIIWIVGITNTINLIDGLDGLAAGVTVISAVAIGYSAYIQGYYTVTFVMLALAGSGLGFLPFNFFPAKTFMGDGGALFLGFMLASVSILDPAKGATVVAISVPVLVLGVPIFDILFAILRRVKVGRSIFSADKGHLHHQLSGIGMGQRRAVLMIYGISGIMGIAAILLTRRLYLEAGFLFLIALLFILLFVWDWNKRGKKQ
jgi:UDP-GlcNAc:undecaprenyl-phosphate GlcNAc-1-phosphate transferase